MKKTIIVIIVLVVIIGVYYFVSNKKSYDVPTLMDNSQVQTQTNPEPVVNTNTITTNVAPLNASVSIKNFSFSPATLNVKTGTKVTWVNNDSVGHTVTSDTNGIFDSGIISPGQSFSFTFVNAGSIGYHCTPHPMMKGNVVVEN
ncbi:MAG: cupredoxin family copper-binding protein [Candidatus Nomurabacteria bacterium]|nr:cupredoxin family copper-binding protein [Candidatus Nomurabacteria bacterium]